MATKKRQKKLIPFMDRPMPELINVEFTPAQAKWLVKELKRAIEAEGKATRLTKLESFMRELAWKIDTCYRLFTAAPPSKIERK